ncbi:MAG: ATP-grasp domain-containing protein [Chloroflexi bacterium]|nr:ATP-grasp domain-containing protein [Chloroflexota bacterium]
MTTVLVTAVGGIAGYGVVRSLRAARPGVRIVGVDTDPAAVGLRWCDTGVLVPPAADPGFLAALADVIRLTGTDVVIPTHPAEILPLARWDAPPVPIVVDRVELVERAIDKWETFRWLCEHEDPSAIPSAIPDPSPTVPASTSFEELRATLRTPFIVKPRRGSGSQGVRRVSSFEELTEATHPDPGAMIAQRLVGSDDEEYSAALFGDGSGGIAARIVLHRALDRGGWTRRASLASPAGLDAVLERLAAILRPRGPINLQLRREADHWWLLEVNPRISSSTSMRATLGYPEAAMAVDHALHGILPTQPTLRAGTVWRYVEDLVG